MIASTQTSRPAAFSQMDLMETHVAIATMGSQLYAKAAGIVKDALMHDHAENLRRYHGNKPSAEVLLAIRDLPRLRPILGRDVLNDIAELLAAHAVFTRSHPQDEPDWRNKLTDISVEMKIEGEGFDVPALRADRNCDRLAQVFGSLWS